ncbi:TRAP transporter permease [Sporosarcina soli]|uniref:TRAP transporter permease n=1 Tax=Sporosarcina soli TaxID=334736 RepID=A0ABW0TPI6_9BACL
MDRKIIIRIVGVTCLALATFHLYAAGVKIFPPLQQRSMHYGLALVIIFLTYPLITKKDGDNMERQEEGRIPIIISFLLALLSIWVTGYVFLNHISLLTAISNPSTMTIVIGAIMIILTLEATRRTLGWALPIISGIFIIYALLGNKLPLLFAHTGYSFADVVSKVGMSNVGIFGQPLGVSATYIILYVIFGSLLAASGAGKLFIDLSMAAVGRYRGGAAKVSIVSSALSGTISGNPVSNVVTTGVLTIPLMKKQGYKSEYAGAVETISSTGGIILPPIMGAVAFLIADFLQVEYAEVAFAAIIPAILYFVAVFIMVDLNAARLETSSGLKREENVYNVKELLLTKGHLLIPIFVLVYFLLVERNTPIYSAFWAIISIPLVCLIRKETRMSIRKIVESLQEGVKLSLMVVSACACAGIVIGVIDMTGIGLRFAGILTDLAGGSLFLLLVLTMVSSIILGMGLPPVAAYLVLAIVVGPALIEFGVTPMAAHMFIFYYGCLSVITPPVAVAAFAASSLAKSNPNKTALIALRLGLTAFIVPFLFVYGPELLMDGSTMEIALACVSALVGVFALSVALEGYLISEINIYTRVIMFLAALLLMSVGMLTDIIGALIVTLITAIEFKKHGEIRKVGIKTTKVS